MSNINYKTIESNEVTIEVKEIKKFGIRYKNSLLLKEFFASVIGFLGMAGIFYIPFIFLNYKWMKNSYLFFMSFAIIVVTLNNYNYSKKVLKNKSIIEYLFFKIISIALLLGLLSSIALCIIVVLSFFKVVNISYLLEKFNLEFILNLGFVEKLLN